MVARQIIEASILERLPIVSRITMHSLILTIILDQCEVSYISPDNNEDSQDYPPLLNLTFVSKVFEHVVAKKIDDYIPKIDLHNQFQYAYR